MKIAVIFTGGTIGSKIKDGWISTDGQTKFELVENFKACDNRNIEFVCSEPYFILSENLSATELNLLISAYKEAEKSDVDGIIITHGTDSLQFSAALLSLVSQNDKPAVLVSANYPLNDARSNGMANFKAAVDFIEKKCGKGVFVSYKNTDGRHFFHRGHRTIAFLEGDDRLYSLNHAPYAEYINRDIRILEEDPPYLAAPLSPLCETSGILCISSLPGDGFDYSLNGIQAVILRPYHSGTVSTSNPEFAGFCKKARENGVPVFLVNAPKSTTYDSARLYKDLCIIPLPDVTFAEAYMRLWLGVSIGEELKNIF